MSSGIFVYSFQYTIKILKAAKLALLLWSTDIGIMFIAAGFEMKSPLRGFITQYTGGSDTLPMSPFKLKLFAICPRYSSITQIEASAALYCSL